MSRRRIEGGETWSRLCEWTRGQPASERLAVQILRVEGFSSIDPSHPLGGPDGLKDVICLRDGIRWVGAAYFPRGQQSFGETAGKFSHDLGGVTANEVSGFAFVTNQELSLGERKQLRERVDDIEFELLHLERIASILDSPQCYGIRLEFLDIEMTKEEQIAFIAARDAVIEQLQHTLDRILLYFQNSGLLSELPIEEIRESIPLADIQRFKEILDTIAGSDPYRFMASGFLLRPGHIGDLRVPLEELKEFADLLDRIAGNRDLFNGVTSLGILPGPSHVRDLHVPTDELQKYEAILDRVIEKLKEKDQLEDNLRSGSSREKAT